PRTAPEVPGGAEPAGRCTEPPAGDRGALSGAQVEPKLPGAPEPAGEHREPRGDRAAPLQRVGPRLQHGGSELPRQPPCVVPGLRYKPVLRAAPRKRGRAEGPVLAVPPAGRRGGQRCRWTACAA